MSILLMPWSNYFEKKDLRIIFYDNKNKEVYQKFPIKQGEHFLLDDNYILDNLKEFKFKYQEKNDKWENITEYAPLKDMKSFDSFLLNTSKNENILTYDILLSSFANDMTQEEEKLLSISVYNIMRNFIWANARVVDFKNVKSFIDAMKRKGVKTSFLSNVLFYLEKYIKLKELFIEHSLTSLNFHKNFPMEINDSLRKALDDIVTDCVSQSDLQAADIIRGKILSFLGNREEAATIFSKAFKYESNHIVDFLRFDEGANTFVVQLNEEIGTKKRTIRFLTEYDHPDDTVILISVDVNFLRYYGAQLLFYISALKKYHFHFHVIGDPFEVGSTISETHDLMDKINKYRNSRKVNLPTFSTEEVPEYVKESKTYFACSRYLHAREIMNRFDKHVLIIDADMFIESDLKGYLDNLKKTDITLPFASGIVTLCPWRRILAGNVFLGNNENSRKFLEHVEKYIYHNLDKTFNWMLDQNALSYAYEKIYSFESNILIGNCNMFKRPMLQKPIGRLVERV